MQVFENSRKTLLFLFWSPSSPCILSWSLRHHHYPSPPSLDVSILGRLHYALWCIDYESIWRAWLPITLGATYQMSIATITTGLDGLNVADWHAWQSYCMLQQVMLVHGSGRRYTMSRRPRMNGAMMLWRGVLYRHFRIRSFRDKRDSHGFVLCPVYDAFCCTWKAVPKVDGAFRSLNPEENGAQKVPSRAQTSPSPPSPHPHS
jgi:hypothetical protein